MYDPFIRLPSNSDLQAEIRAVSWMVEELWWAMRKSGQLSQESQAEARYSPDHRSANWYGTLYTFTAAQAACVAIWREAMRNGTPDVGDDYVERAVEIDSSLRQLFRDNPAWRTMIVEGSTKGTHRLAEPPK